MIEDHTRISRCKTILNQIFVRCRRLFFLHRSVDLFFAGFVSSSGFAPCIAADASSNSDRVHWRQFEFQFRSIDATTQSADPLVTDHNSERTTLARKSGLYCRFAGNSDGASDRANVSVRRPGNSIRRQNIEQTIGSVVCSSRIHTAQILAMIHRDSIHPMAINHVQHWSFQL